MPDSIAYLRSPTCWALFFGSLFATAALTPVAMRLSRRLGALDTGGHRRIYEGSMPLLGGLSIALPFVLACLLGLAAPSGMYRLVASFEPQFLALALGSLAIVALGIYDDTRGLRVRYKLLVQTLIAVSVVLAGGDVLSVVRLPFVGDLELSAGVGILISVAWIVGLVNAINIIDGIDGLATGVSLIAAVGLLILGSLGEYTFVVLMCSALAGSLIGFLPFNYHPASIFLGDTGSMFLGFALSTIALMNTYKSETAVIVLGPLLALGFPIFETLVSMARRIARGAPLFMADDHHTHHRLLGRGYSQRGVVLLLCGVSAVLTSIAIMIRIVPEGTSWDGVLLAGAVATLVAIGWLAGYLRVVPVNALVEQRERNNILQAFARYAIANFKPAEDLEKAREVLSIGCQELGLRSLSVRSDRGAWSLAVTEGLGAVDHEVERLRLKRNQQELWIEYVFAGDPDEETRRDVAACLARIFERAELPARADRESTPT